MQRGGFAELILDETSQFRLEHHRVAVDRQVGVLVVIAVELVCGQFDDPREGNCEVLQCLLSCRLGDEVFYSGEGPPRQVQ
ncbi:hypothetical protein [Streptomyces sp. YIM B13508]|uniref:hypothetical protein n=1 Tax=Streptomyces sp. YIM B13508 TaxID=3366315 RepID=UPI0036C637AC